MEIHYRNLWWAIDHVLAGMRMPYVAPERRMNFGGALEAYNDDLPLLYGAGIRAVACLLNIPSDTVIFETAGFEFRCWPIVDGHPPTLDQVNAFVAFVNDCRARRLPVAVFCEAGLGRTGTMIAAYLVQSGKTAHDAIAAVRARQPSAIETQSQILFLEHLEDWKNEGQGQQFAE
jgi:atypical dual specificity phosphatase